MPGVRNEKERNRIFVHAVRLFMAKGYTKTTYKEIAEACATTKSMVQHYFPKKEMIAERFFREKLDDFQAQAASVMSANNSLLDLLTCVGLLHYDYILNDPRAALFCADLLENRALTNNILMEEFRWAAERIRNTAPEGVTMQAQFLVALGGAYDLMYKAHISGESLLASSVQFAAMLAFWLPLGLSDVEIRDAVRRAQELTGVR